MYIRKHKRGLLEVYLLVVRQQFIANILNDHTVVSACFITLLPSLRTNCNTHAPTPEEPPARSALHCPNFGLIR